MTGSGRAMADSVLVDTSAWIAFFRRADKAIGEKVSHLLRNGNPAMAGIIMTELRRGAKFKRELDVIDDLHRSIEYLEMQEEYFAAAGDIGRSLLQKGITVGTVDLLIAQLAIAHDVPVLTLDAHFTAIARHARLKLY
jgi:predicted nucleic acid-binding protein